MRPPLALVVLEDPELRGAIESAVATLQGRSVHAGDETTLVRSLERHAVSMIFVAADPTAVPLDRVMLAARRRRPEAPVIVVGSGILEPIGVEPEVLEILAPPLGHEQLERAVRRAAVQHELLSEIARLRGLAGTPDPMDALVGRSESMAVLRERIGAAAGRERAVLLAGESGTGRALAARTIHAVSPRRAGPFVRLDCGQVEAALLDDRSTEWAETALDQAREGTLFLAEVDRLSPARQRQLAALLRARSGSEEVRRVASAANDLEAAVSTGEFDGSLRALLAEEPLRVPPLRERGSDVLLIARRHLETVCALNALPPARLEPAAVSLLESYPWPGNVAELRETLEGALTLAADGIIRPEHFSDAVRTAAAGSVGAETSGAPRRFRDAKRRVVNSFERSYLEELLGWHRGNVTAAAQQAGMLRSALQRLLRKHDLRSSDFRGRGPGGARRLSS